jgi:hypothetical protein
MQEKNIKISLSKCKDILKKDSALYTDAEIVELRDFLYELAMMDYEVFIKLKKRDEEFEKIKQIKKLENENTDLDQAA